MFFAPEMGGYFLEYNNFVPADPLQNALYHLNGRVGNVLLVNGREAGDVTLPVTNGGIV